MARHRALPTRRRFLKGSLAVAGLGLCSGCGLVSIPGQRPGLPRIGYLGAGSATNTSTREFLAGMRDLGYVEGRTVHIDWRFDEGRSERLPDLAAELVQLKPDVLVAGGSTPPAVAAKRATSTIPIIFMAVSDPIGTGLIASFAHPEGNATGTSNISAEVSAKRLQMVKELLPSATRVDYMLNGGNPAAEPEWRGVQEPARQLGLTLRQQDGRDADRVEQAFDAMAGARPDAIIVIADGAIYEHRRQIVELAMSVGAPLIANHRDFVELGGLLMYGADLADNFRRSAIYVDKVLKGAKPAELPVERPTRFDVIVNLKAAQALGLTVPQSVLSQATEIIQ